jgi:hypothetical protein
MKKLLILLLGAPVLAICIWVLPAYLVDRDLGISRLLSAGDPRFVTYHRFFLAIEPRMTRAEVEATMETFYPPGGERKAPTRVDDTADQLFLFMNPEHRKEPNCEGISIRFENGKVTGKGYSMD